MTFHVKTTVFEGPLDLLLQLITRHQVEISSVGLTEVVADYLALIQEMRQLDIDVTSEFLLIAATLIQLKARSLLPTSAELDLDEELALAEERDRLLSRLLMCVTFKDVAAVLLRRMQETNRLVPHTGGIDQKVSPPPPDLQLALDAASLASLAASVLARLDREPDLDHLDLELPSVESAIEDLRERVRAVTVTSFETLTDHCSNAMEVAAYFLALLEMARWGLIEVSQRDWMAQIEVSHRADAGSGLTSEWSR